MKKITSSVRKVDLDKERYSVAIHEAGHAVISHALQLPFWKIVLNKYYFWGGSMKRSKGSRENINRGDDSRLQKEVVINMAGRVAELNLWRTKDPEIKGRIFQNSSNDFSFAYDLCYHISDNEINHSQCLKTAKQLVTSNWRAIRAVAEKLFKDGSVEYSEVVNVIKEQGKDIENKKGM